MSIQTAEGFECGKWDEKRLEIDAIEENLTSDDGLLVLSQLNTIDDPTQGKQQLTFFHGYYKQHQ